MFEGFARHTVDVGPVRINAVSGGSGPAILLLHGYPQTLEQWAYVAPLLTDEFTVVCADLRGYGRSSKPEGEGEVYSFRAMAADQLAVMDELGHETFVVAGHDRGGRVAHRMALDAPERVSALVPCDVVPTWAMYHGVDRERAARYWQWYFLPLPPPFPERLIGGDPDYYFENCLVTNGGTGLEEGFRPEQLEAYRSAWRDPEMIRASCADYRAGATVDLEHDAADLDVLLEVPTFPVWGAEGLLKDLFDIEAEWRRRCAHVVGRTVPGGHFFPDQQPEATAEVIRSAAHDAAAVRA
ncbi:alpha/beta hydrolase [Ornithinimicrobium humiphilum]|uniref:Haloacetate dehalogenase n=1 Tax=Ornithinimicrobium humiphilum TaxID=125288 RepID=A0A543KRS6_9MICO|nr:alpha/beta hydrolase [Ornithinimicrobium humiphilum]TQM97769.1 haloacetate dehalogenase [Ornithinimicrobium humiphilum]